MDSESIGYWNQKKEKLKNAYPIITEEDLSYIVGKEKEMIELLGYKLGKTIEEVRYLVNTL